MKVVVVQFPDETDISSLTAGVVAQVNAVTGGRVLAAAPVYETPGAVSPHKHAVAGQTGDPVPDVTPAAFKPLVPPHG
jgi:hypothetical protein